MPSPVLLDREGHLSAARRGPRHGRIVAAASNDNFVFAMPRRGDKRYRGAEIDIRSLLEFCL